MARAKSAPKDSTADLVFEAKLWLAADKPLYNADTVKYIHAVLGLRTDDEPNTISTYGLAP